MLFNWSHKKPINPLPRALSPPLPPHPHSSLSLSPSNHQDCVSARATSLSVRHYCTTVLFQSHFKSNNSCEIQMCKSLKIDKKKKKKTGLKSFWTKRGEHKGEKLHVIASFFFFFYLFILRIYGFWQYICSQENSNSGSQYWICQAQAI